MQRATAAVVSLSVKGDRDRDSSIPVHFFPAIRRPGARPVCGARAVPLISTAIPAEVTCRRCAASGAVRSAAALGRAELAVLWPDAELVALGLLPAGSPPRPPPPEHYRNPNLIDPGRDPLAALVDRLRARAERARGEVRAAIASAAAELDDVLATLRAGGW